MDWELGLGSDLHCHIWCTSVVIVCVWGRGEGRDMWFTVHHHLLCVCLCVCVASKGQPEWSSLRSGTSEWVRVAYGVSCVGDTCTLRNVLPNHCVEGQHTVGLCWLNVNFLVVCACTCEYSFRIMKEKA